jgi:DNA-binding GntR family transcriptional regulator
MRSVGLSFSTKREAVVQALRTEILEGNLLPGEQIEQDEIATRFGVSSTPVREAFAVLESEGYIEMRAHRGAVVASPGYEELIDISQIRNLLETYAIRHALRSEIDPTVERLRVAARQIERALEDDDIAEVRRANYAFHQALIAIAGSTTLSDLVKRLGARSHFFFPNDSDHFRHSNAEHMQMIRLLEDRDFAGLEELLGRHTRSNTARLRQALEAARGSQHSSPGDAPMMEEKSRLPNGRPDR